MPEFRRLPGGTWVDPKGHAAGRVRRRRLERRWRRSQLLPAGGQPPFDDGSGGGDPAGDREPRRPRPAPAAASAALDLPE